jgi:DHA2 family methylenomycin A resistance protein-like MFS transporter
MTATTSRTTRLALTASVLGFFVVTLDATIVNVVLPSIRADLGGGVTGMQWVVDGYTLTFAVLLLTAGSLTDRLGARHALIAGVVGFAAASAACGAAPSIAVLVAARVAQGAAAAMIMPASMALIRQAFPDPVERGRALGAWATGGALASTSGPLLGGALTEIDWRWVFFINLPVAAIAVALLRRVPTSDRRQAPLDRAGQIAAAVAMAGLTFGAIEAGTKGLRSPVVIVALVLAVVGALAFARIESRVAHPMLPLSLLHIRAVPVCMLAGFAFMVGFFGLPFIASLYLQEMRGLSALATGAMFLPMVLAGLILSPPAPRIFERLGRRTTLVGGLGMLTAGLVAMAFLPTGVPLWVYSAAMVLVGVTGPLITPPASALLLDAVPAHQAGTASGVFNTARQVGGALGVAVFGGLLAHRDSFTAGMTQSFLIAAAVTATAAVVATRLRHTAGAPATPDHPVLLSD